MFEAEARRPDGIRAVSIATPNNTHFEICRAALLAGLHVVCEKPLCFTTAEALQLLELSRASRRIVGVAYGYAGPQPLAHGPREGRPGAPGGVPHPPLPPPPPYPVGPVQGRRAHPPTPPTPHAPFP